METAKKTKISFKMPHLLFMMIGLIILMSLLTYILPTGEYMEVDGVQQYVSCDRSPVNLGQCLLYVFQGIVNSASVIALLLIMGGGIAIVLGTKAIDRIIDYVLYKLQDKGIVVVIPCVFVLIAFVGGFAIEGSVALFPLGILVARKMKMDPIGAAGITVLASLVGWASSPMSCYVAQSMIGIPMYSGFGVRLLNWTICCIITIIFVILYTKRVQKDPSKSLMGSDEWLKKLENDDIKIEKKEISFRDIAILVIFLCQFALYLYLMLVRGFGMEALPAVMLPATILCGIINGSSFDKIGKDFENGTKDMSFLCVLIGLAGVISLIMSNGKILGTITYYLSMPLQGLGTGFATIGIAAVIAAINFFIPSASAKAAALIPIIKPMAEMLSISPQLAVQAFQVGDGFMNILSPFNGVTLAGIALCNISYAKWAKFTIPLMVIFYIVEFIMLYILTGIGWA